MSFSREVKMHNKRGWKYSTIDLFLSFFRNKFELLHNSYTPFQTYIHILIQYFTKLYCIAKSNYVTLIELFFWVNTLYGLGGISVQTYSNAYCDKFCLKPRVFFLTKEVENNVLGVKR